MPLPNSWLPFVFPAALRGDRRWIDPFSKNRRTYLLGFASASYAVRRPKIDDVRRLLSDQFKEDPRRYIPLEGWRAEFPHTGDERSTIERYIKPPPEFKHTDCRRWGQFGKDQPEHAWLKRPMRLYDALKCVAALYEAADVEGIHVIGPAPDAHELPVGNLALHLAIFKLTRFTSEYYKRNLIGKEETLAELYDYCGLSSTLNGAPARTFYEMSEGLSATERTCASMRTFCSEKGLPDPGTIQMDLSTRGANRTHRSLVKNDREGPIKYYSEDCCVEIFLD